MRDNLIFTRFPGADGRGIANCEDKVLKEGTLYENCKRLPMCMVATTLQKLYALYNNDMAVTLKQI